VMSTAATGYNQDVNAEKLRRERLEKEWATERSSATFSRGSIVSPQGQMMQPIASVTQTFPAQTTMDTSMPVSQASYVGPEEVFTENRSLPPVIHERVIPVEREEIQPIIRREREKTEIVQVEAPSYESEIRPTVITERQLPAEVRPQVIASSKDADLKVQEFQTHYQSTTERAPAEHRIIEKPAIIEEHIKKTIIEEVQPVIHKEIVEPHIIREVKPIYEKIVEAPTVTKLVKEMVGLHLEDHYKHHSHHSKFLSGNVECLECKNFHQMSEACQLCRPLHYYENCNDCGYLRQSGISLPPFPGSENLHHTQHHAHHMNVLNKRENCIDCSSWHSSQSCNFCKPEYYFENCGECNKLRSTGMNLPRWSGVSYPTGYSTSTQQPYSGTSVTSTTTFISPTTFVSPTTTTTGLKEGPATTTVSQKRTEPILKSM